MQQNRFVVLTGHLSNYPLSDLVGILRHQRKSGRLTIEYPGGPASLFFQDGELVDAQMNELTGLQAVCVAMAEPESAFNFNPLIGVSRRSIPVSAQRVVSELLGCWDESPLEIVTAPVSQPISSTTDNELSERREPLLLPASPLPTFQRRTVLLVASAGLLGFALSTLIITLVGFNFFVTSAEASRTQKPSNFSESAHLPDSTLAATEKVTTPNEKLRVSEQRRSHTQAALTKEQKQLQTSSRSDSEPSSTTTSSEESAKSNNAAIPSINVVLQIENGRVVRASIANHKPGMDSYEGLALRIARQRRYPARQNSLETIRINVP